MEYRKILNGSPALVIGVVVVAVAVAGWVAWKQIAEAAGARPSTAAFYSVDDGKTWFTDEASRIAPFDKDGKQAVRAYVFQCSDGTQGVGYLERYTEKAKPILERFVAETKASPGRQPASAMQLAALGTATKEVKRPGEAKWVPIGSVNVRELALITCKDGGTSTQVAP